MWVGGGVNPDGTDSATGHRFDPPPAEVMWAVCLFGDFTITKIGKYWLATVGHINYQTSQAVESDGTVHNIHRIEGLPDGCALWRVKDGDPGFSRWMNIWEGPFPAGTPLLGVSKGTTLAPQLNWGSAVAYESAADQVSWNFNPGIRGGIEYSDGDSGSGLYAQNIASKEWLIAAVIESGGTAARTLQTYLPLIKSTLGSEYVPYAEEVNAMTDAELTALVQATVAQATTTSNARIEALELQLAAMDTGGGTEAGAVASAAFIKADVATSGNWRGVYGTQGTVIVGGEGPPPTFVKTVMSANTLTFIWAISSKSASALQKVGNSTDRALACWYCVSVFTIEVNLTDGQPHQVALYCCDYDNLRRTQTVEVLDAATGVVLDTQNVSGFSGGVYLAWTVVGHVTFRLSNTGGPKLNAVLSALFFD